MEHDTGENRVYYTLRGWFSRACWKWQVDAFARPGRSLREADIPADYKVLHSQTVPETDPLLWWDTPQDVEG